jgi:hypothetical protein
MPVFGLNLDLFLIFLRLFTIYLFTNYIFFYICTS